MSHIAIDARVINSGTGTYVVKLLEHLQKIDYYNTYSILVPTKDKNYWRYRIKAIENNYVSAWDWQWFFTLSAYNQLSIYPRIGLISNIGFGKDATHTTAGAKQLQSKAEGQLEFPLQHPKYVVPYEDFEQGFYKSNNTFRNTILQLIPFSIKTILKKWIRG